MGSVSSDELTSRATGDEGSMLSGRRTARPHRGNGHHFKLGLLSTNSYQKYVSTRHL